jgi:hypothetical protein
MMPVRKRELPLTLAAIEGLQLKSERGVHVPFYTPNSMYLVAHMMASTLSKEPAMLCAGLLKRSGTWRNGVGLGGGI